MLPLGGCSAAEEGLLLAGCCRWEAVRRLRKDYCWPVREEEDAGTGWRRKKPKAEEIGLCFLEEMERQPLVFSLRRKGDGETD